MLKFNTTFHDILPKQVLSSTPKMRLYGSNGLFEDMHQKNVLKDAHMSCNCS